jgi:uncharacterized protein YjbJ (UPF0337 family)
MNSDQVKGHIEAAKGKVKEVVGIVVGNKEMEQMGKKENAMGKNQVKKGDIKESKKAK